MYKIESLDHYGRGITKIENKITFVKNALPGEIVEISITSNKNKYNEASVKKYIKKSNKRINVPCPYYNQCGGCNIMHLEYLNQLKFKQNKIENIVSKYLKEEIKINDIVKCDSPLGYRNKIELQVDKDLGFYDDNSHKIISIDNCLISNHAINESINYLKKLDLSKITKITCKTGNGLMIVIETNYEDLNIDCIKEIAKSIYLKVNNNFIHKYGDKYIYEELEDYKFLISPDSFFQINKDICIKLYNKIKEYVGTNQNVLDLYCGTGSIGIFINENNNVTGIELNKYAVEDANNNKKINNIENIKFICSDSGQALSNIDKKQDIIIVDPPRSGLNKETIQNIVKLKPKKIIYVSCDPMTLVRDLNVFKDTYKIIEITPYDMFPNTYHIECVTLLCRKNL